MLFAEIKSLSEQSFVAPYKLIGDTALSVDKAKTLDIFLLSIDASKIFCAPIIFVLTYSMGLYSAVGTCFKAAACMTISTSLKKIL